MTDLFNGLFTTLFAGLFGSVQDINFEYRLNGGVILPLGSSPATIENLDFGTEYLLEIRAVIQGVPGDWSETVFTTKEINFEYRLNGGVILPLGSSPATIENLDFGTEYLLEIRAVIQGVPGDWSETVFTTEGSFEYRLNGGEIFPLDLSPATIEDLISGTEYLLEIRAIKEGVPGDWSETLFTTDEYKELTIDLNNSIKEYSVVKTLTQNQNTDLNNSIKEYSTVKTLTQNQNTDLNNSNYQLLILITAIRLHSTGDYIECYDTGEYKAFECHDMGEFELEVF